MHRLGVVVPYRDREEHLGMFIPTLCEYLSSKSIDYRIIVVEQHDSKPFNRGSLLNLGFIKAEDLGCDYVVFHDIDMIPVDVDYSYSYTPLELVKSFVKDLNERCAVSAEHVLKDYFGGVTLFSVQSFRKINGYSNRYRGWGFEDNDLLRRCLEKGILLGEKAVRKAAYCGPAVYFSGEKNSFLKNSFLKAGRKIVTGNKAFTFIVTFQSLVDLGQEACIFSIPGADCTLAVEPYGTLKFECFTTDLKCFSLHTKDHIDQETHQAAVVIAPDECLLYVDGVCVDFWKNRGEQHPEFHSNSVYLGIGNPTLEKRRNFRGRISNFVVFEGILSSEAIRDIYRNPNKGYTGDIEAYKAKDHRRLTYFDARFQDGNLTDSKHVVYVNLSGGEGFVGKTGTVREDSVISPEFWSKAVIPLGRPGTFYSLEHTKQAYGVKGYEMGEDSVKNRDRFREVSRLETYSSVDGLSNVEDIYKIESQEKREVEGHPYFLLKVVEK